MREVTTKYNRFHAQMQTFIRHGVKFRHTIGKNTEEINYGKDFRKSICYVTELLEPESLKFIKEVRKYANSIDTPQQKIPKIWYWSKARIPDRQTYSKCLEVDVNKAYWVLAYQNGYIDDRIFKKGLEVEKQTRLIAFGSIASVKEVWEHKENGTFVKVMDIVNHRTRSYFLDICSKLDDIMQRGLERNDNHVLFYWVDAFFCMNTTDYHHDKNKKLIEFINGNGLGAKSLDIDYVTRSGNMVRVKRSDKEKEKIYPIPIRINRQKTVALKYF